MSSPCGLPTENGMRTLARSSVDKYDGRNIGTNAPAIISFEETALRTFCSSLTSTQYVGFSALWLYYLSLCVYEVLEDMIFLVFTRRTKKDK